MKFTASNKTTFISIIVGQLTLLIIWASLFTVNYKNLSLPEDNYAVFIGLGISLLVMLTMIFAVSYIVLKKGVNN